MTEEGASMCKCRKLPAAPSAITEVEVTPRLEPDSSSVVVEAYSLSSLDSRLYLPLEIAASLYLELGQALSWLEDRKPR
jgi:hypothetical protein